MQKELKQFDPATLDAASTTLLDSTQKLVQGLANAMKGSASAATFQQTTELATDITKQLVTLPVTEQNLPLLINIGTYLQ